MAKRKKSDLCCKCKKNKKRAGQKYCNECHASYMRDNRPKHSELLPEQRLKANARSYLNTYLKRGKIKKKPCEICGDENVQAHHDDYTKPLEVRWLCNKHHKKYHQDQLKKIK